MKHVTYIPEVCKGENPTFSGTIILRPPTFDEKYELLEVSGIEIADDNSVKMPSGNSRLRLMRALVKASEKNYVTVSLKRLADGEEMKSFQDLSTAPDCHEILINVATELLHGFKMGKQ